MPQKNGGRGREQETFRYEVLRHYGVLSTSNRGWTRELNLIRWNNRKAKYDLRDWSPDHDKMSKGITLTEDEILALMSLVEDNLGDFTGEDEEEQAPLVLETKAAEEKAYADSEASGETGTRDFAGELYEEETA